MGAIDPFDSDPRCSEYSGRETDSKCSYCNGRGKRFGPFPLIPIGPIIVLNPLNVEECRHCHGTGKEKK